MHLWKCTRKEQQRCEKDEQQQQHEIHGDGRVQNAEIRGNRREEAEPGGDQSGQARELLTKFGRRNFLLSSTPALQVKFRTPSLMASPAFLLFCSPLA